MKKLAKLLTIGLFGTTAIGTVAISTTSSNQVKDVKTNSVSSTKLGLSTPGSIGNSDGTDWEGHIGGTLQMKFDDKKMTCYIDYCIRYIARNLVIPNFVRGSNGKSYILNAIDKGAFDVTDKLTGSLTIGCAVETIGEKAFRNSKELEEIYFPDGVNKIGIEAFCNCKSLRVLYLPKIKTIEKYAFCDCTNLTFVSIPESVREIKEAAFIGCSNLGYIRCNFSKAPKIWWDHDPNWSVFSGLPPTGHVRNLNPAYSSKDLLHLMQTKRLPSGWTAY